MLFTLHRERALELCLGQEFQLDEQPAEWTPRRRRGLRRRCGIRRHLEARRVQVDTVLLRQDSCQREGGQVAVADEDLTQEATAPRLFAECQLELVFRQELLGDQQLAELAPGE